MYSRWLKQFAVSILFPLSLSWGQIAGAKDSSGPDNPEARGAVPKGVILVQGAWSSASDSLAPLPENGKIEDNVYRNAYFGVSWALPKDWTEKFKGPPPSDQGRYVLTDVVPNDTFTGPRGSVLITADDLFFAPFPVEHGAELIDFIKEHLRPDYKVERPPTEITIAGRPFRFFAYWSPAAELHWSVFVTQIRCHAVEIVVSSSDTKLIRQLTQDLNAMTLPPEDAPADGNSIPVCLKDYVNGDTVISRVDPVFSERRFNTVPVRIVIGKDGKVKHIHFLSAFPDQARAITDALGRWSFKPHLRNGQPVEVETGIEFGYGSHAPVSAAGAHRPW